MGLITSQQNQQKIHRQPERPAEGADVLGELKRTQDACSRLSERIDEQEQAMETLTKKVDSLNTRYREDYVTTKKKQADDINNHILTNLQEVENASERLKDVSLDDMTVKYHKFTKTVLKELTEGENEVRKLNAGKIDENMKAILKWLWVPFLIWLLVYMMLQLLPYIQKGITSVMQNETASEWITIMFVVWIGTMMFLLARWAKNKGDKDSSY